MILLDENIPKSQRLSLLRWKPLQIGFDYLDKSVKDDQIATRLRATRRVTFFTLDRDFFSKRRRYGHANTGIVFVDAPDDRFSAIVDRFLRHHSFRTHTSRMGVVFKLGELSITCWRVADQSQTEISWT